MATVNRTATATATEQLPLSRAEQRKQRQLELESEQAAEEAEALKMTEEQRHTLFQPFAAVKAEFSDLDGLRWTQAALRMLQPRQRHVQPLTPVHHRLKSSTFVVLTPADLASFKPEDTIRVSPTGKSRTPFAGDTVGSTTATPTPREAARPRSPVKDHFTPSKPPLDDVDVSNPFDPHQPGLGDDIANNLTRNRPLPPLPDNVHVPPGLTPLPAYQSTFEDYHVSPFPSSPAAPPHDVFTEGFSLLDDLGSSPNPVPPSAQVQPNSAHRARLQAILGNGNGFAVGSPEVLNPFHHPRPDDPFSLSHPTRTLTASDFLHSDQSGQNQSPLLTADCPLQPNATPCRGPPRQGRIYDFGDEFDMEVDMDAEATPMPSPTMRRNVPLASPPLMCLAAL